MYLGVLVESLLLRLGELLFIVMTGDSGCGGGDDDCGGCDDGCGGDDGCGAGSGDDGCGGGGGDGDCTYGGGGEDNGDSGQGDEGRYSESSVLNSVSTGGSICIAAKGGVSDT